ncbi:hypothetical protein GCM10017744_096710 [Streptomyces antimycoticus]|uniref:Uncharacterized protein n=1 Tax=Streptomyces antimycoticus TaxID=68175 RepID=A0A4D4K012_9ACTN|nr:hypothetical protein SANT12839_008880 [Streptomyces antimycoticus]
MELSALHTGLQVAAEQPFDGVQPLVERLAGEADLVTALDALTAAGAGGWDA